MIIGISIGFTYRACNEGPPKYVVHTDTIPGDSVPYVVYHDKPIPYYVERWDTALIPYPVFDTIEVIADYFATNYYQDTLKDDTSAFIAYSASVFMNEIQDLKLDFQNRRPTIIHNYHPDKHNAIFIGAGATFKGFDIELGYARKENALSVTYGSQGVGFRYRRYLARW